MTLTDRPSQEWRQLICSYYNGCSAGDVDLMLSTLHPDVEHWFLAPNTGSARVAGAEHLARYWRKVTGMLSARWVVDTIVASGEQAVIEWTMFWSPTTSATRVATRGAEWFTREGGLIREIRSYYQMRDSTTELDGFPYETRGYSVTGRERSALHPDAEQYGVTTSVAGT
jgi:ketosteroid isomerase-like protein